MPETTIDADRRPWYPTSSLGSTCRSVRTLGKSFASTISAWVVPLLALDAARVDTRGQEPAVLPYLAFDRPWGLDIDLEVEWNGLVVSRPP